MHIEIVPPEQTELDGYSSMVATDTRAWIQHFKDTACSTGASKAGLSREAIKESKEKGKDFFNIFADSDFACDLGGIEAIKYGMTVTFLSVFHLPHQLTAFHNEANSYVLEGAVTAYSRWLHSKGLKAADAKGYHRELLDMLKAPVDTSCETDRQYMNRVGALYRGTRYNTSITRYVNLFQNESSYLGDMPLLATEKEAVGHLIITTGTDASAIRKAVLWYTEGDTPMVAGFLSLDDLMKMRFTRRTLGAYIHAITGDSESARITVDEVRKRVAKLSGIRFIPNDAKFSTGYRAAATGIHQLDSCMSRPAEHYDNAPLFQHPVDSYSAAYFGAGDNGLALVMSLDEEGEVRGRGILNTNTNSIVRWYGYHGDKLALEALGIHIDGDCLAGSYLALVQDNAYCLVPYSDSADCGTCEDNRIYMDDTGDIDLQTTSGGAWRSDEPFYEDCLTGDVYPLSELVEQSNGTYYHLANVPDTGAVFCPILECWYPAWQTTRATLNGELHSVSDDAFRGLMIDQFSDWSHVGEYSWVEEDYCITPDGDVELKDDCINVDGVWYLEGSEPREENDEAA